MIYRFWFALFPLIGPVAYSNAAAIEYPLDIPQALIAADCIREAMPAEAPSGASVSLQLETGSSIPGEGFELIRDGNTVTVLAGDPAGLLYGAYELAEQIELYGLEGVKDCRQAPSMALRGMKLNIPLDARTPSYSDLSDSGQFNIPTVWDMEFWKRQIDLLSKYRYNFISLWSLHPFPSMVRVPEFPDVALDDVMRSKGPFEEYYDLTAIGYDDPALVGKLEVVKKMTMEEKVAFWKEVMRYGKERNIDFYIITWNVFTYGTEGKYGLTDDIHNPVTRDYFRASVRTLLETYPDLAGIGLTTGENMRHASFEEKEKWAMETYGLGVLDAVEKSPGRKITFIHRQHQTDSSLITQTFEPLIRHPEVDFIFSFKYAQAHVYATTTPGFADGFVSELGDVETIWTLRNDDTYQLRWAAPDYVREFIKNLPAAVTRGMYFGSDQWIWARQFGDPYPDKPDQLEIEKHWFQWLLWGRLTYDPELSRERLESILGLPYPGIAPRTLLEAWQAASMVYPLVNGFHWRRNDFQWYIEGCLSRPISARTPTGFHDLNAFIDIPPHEGTDNISIPDFVAATVARRELPGTSPLAVADDIRREAGRALALLEDMPDPQDAGAAKVLHDIRDIALLGHYYADKIEAATWLALFRQTGDLGARERSVQSMRRGIWYWRQFAASMVAKNPAELWLNRVGRVDYREIFSSVIYDLRLLGADEDFDPIPFTPGGTVHGPDRARLQFAHRIPGSTGSGGSGYLESLHGEPGTPEVEWTVLAPGAGRYILEVRYALKRPDPCESLLSVNGGTPVQFLAWGVPHRMAWVVDRVVIDLEAGENVISLQPHWSLLLDGINLLPY